MAKAERPSGPVDHKKQLTSLLRSNSHRHRPHKVFADFCELGAIAVSNSVDKHNREKREARYLEIVKQYDKVEVMRFSEMLAHVVMWLEEGFGDKLGELFMSMEFGDHWKGQFFTPYHVGSLMAKMTAIDVKSFVEKKGFITVNDPACGAGCMLIAAAEDIANQGLNYQNVMHATAVDIDLTAVHMAYLQFSLYGIPAVVVHGNSLSLEEWSHWYTPTHVLGGWNRQLRERVLVNDVMSLLKGDFEDVSSREVSAEQNDVMTGENLPAQPFREAVQWDMFIERVAAVDA